MSKNQEEFYGNLKKRRIGSMRRRVKAGAALKAMTPFPSPRRRRHHRRAAGWRTSAQPPSRSVCLSAQRAVGASAKRVNMPQ